MIGQMDIFDFLYPEKVKPLTETAKIATPYSTKSRGKIIAAAKKDINVFSLVVKDEYCPYEGAGGYGYSKNNRNELDGWDFRRGKIITFHFDEKGKRQELWWSWSDFAEEILKLIANGEYRR